jgi:hypothetical protein
LRIASYTIRFLCEVAAVVALVWWGWPWWGLLAGAVVIGFWGVFVAPKAPRRLPDPWRFASELVIFGVATAGYWAVGQQALAVVFAVLAVVTAALARRWPEP